MSATEPRARQVTLADVARYAGVSTAVVSYVINDGPRSVSPAKEAAVRQAVEVLGYRRNNSARSLRTGRTNTLGLILPGTSNPFFGEYADVLYQQAASFGYALLTGCSAGDISAEFSLLKDLAGRSVDGILDATTMSIGDVSRLQHPGVPTVLINCPFPVPGYDTITPDMTAGARAVVEHLIVEHGHTSVLHIAGDHENTEPDARHRGVIEAHQAHNLIAPEALRTAYTSAGAYADTKRLLGSTARPSAIFVSSDVQTLGVLSAIQELGLSVPGDIALGSFDGIDAAQFVNPPLTSARQPLADMAKAAISAVLGSEPPTHRAFPMSLTIGRSCGCS